MAGPNGTKFGTCLWIHLGMEIGQNQFAPRYRRGHWGGGGFRGSTIRKTGKCGQTAGWIGNNFCTYNADESGN